MKFSLCSSSACISVGPHHIKQHSQQRRRQPVRRGHVRVRGYRAAGVHHASAAKVAQPEGRVLRMKTSSKQLAIKVIHHRLSREMKDKRAS